MRARQPDEEGFIERDGVKISYEVFGAGNEPTVLFLPTWSIVHSRLWKGQVGYLARHYRVVTFDGRGNGRSDRPMNPDAYADDEYVADALAVLDATATERAVAVGLSMGGLWALLLASRHPERVVATVALAAAVGHLFDGESADLDAEPAGRPTDPFDDDLEVYEGWAKYNRLHWLRDYDDFLQFFIRQIFSEPHSTKQIEDGIGWGQETDGQTLVNTRYGPVALPDRATAEAMCSTVRGPVLVIHGDSDGIIPHANSERIAELTGGALVTVGGGGHNNPGRDPVFVNRLLRDFIERVAPARTPRHRTWTRALVRPKRALYISSPIGLGHAQRDLAIASELRALHPDLQIDWLAQPPVTAMLEARGEHVHPASRFLASESAHVTDESHEHDLHAFRAVRRMDEILVNNFMVFDDVVTDEPYDVWIGDEAWDLDYFLHENPELKRVPFVWMTDFVGWLPMPDGGDREAAITADYNAEMIEQVARFRRVRDRSIFVGNPDDIVGDAFGPDLPAIRAWTEANFDFSGYITGFDPDELGDRAALRSELGYRPNERVCIVTVGGSGVGSALLRKVIAAQPEAARRVPGLRMIAVAGPRIDPSSLDAPAGVEVRAFVPDLYRHLAACDLAVVQGGLTTCMELTANGRPFLYFPLAHHFEQTFHVRHRLDRHGAGRCMDYATSTPEAIAAAMAEEIDRHVSYRSVETDGAARAAAMIAELL